MNLNTRQLAVKIRPMARVSIQTTDFDLSQEVAALRAQDGGVGAVAAFVGTVREASSGASVSRMELEHYPGMTEAAIEAMIDEALRRFALRGVRVIHRVGLLEAREQIVLVLVTSAHRGDAFRAAVPDGLPQDPGAVLEEGTHAQWCPLGGRPCGRRRGAGALGHRGEECGGGG